MKAYEIFKALDELLDRVDKHYAEIIDAENSTDRQVVHAEQAAQKSAAAIDAVKNLFRNFPA